MRRTTIAVLGFLLVLALTVGLLTYAYLAPAPLPTIGGYELRAKYGGLNWPVAVAFATDGRIFFAERLTGDIRIIENGSVVPTPFYSLEGLDASGERGFLGLALSPGFPQDPWVFSYYTYNDAANGTYENRIVRILASKDTGTAMEILLGGIPSQTIHNGGVIAFGPDGKLWAVVGDAADPNSAQDLSRRTGKVLRLNADGSVPSDNPFVSTPGADPYVFTYGHRNLFGIAFHPSTHAAYVTENGPSDNDEINLLVAGGNYGWPVVRGVAETPPYLDPVLAYTPVIVPTNAAFATAAFYPAFHGDLLFGDYADHRLHVLRLEPPVYGRVLNDSVVAVAPAGILDVETSPDGYVWVTTSSGLYRLEPILVAAGTRTGLFAQAFALPVETLVWGPVFPAEDAVVPHPERRSGQGLPCSGVEHAA